MEAGIANIDPNMTVTAAPVVLLERHVEVQEQRRKAEPGAGHDARSPGRARSRDRRGPVPSLAAAMHAHAEEAPAAG